MKKFDKKLTLNRETVRNLTHSDLDEVAGGRPPIPCDISDASFENCDTDTCTVGCHPTGGTTTGGGSGTSPKCCNICNVTD